MFKETMRSHPDDKGFTFESQEGKAAWQMAEKMAFAGYSVKLARDPGMPWIVTVREVEACNLTAPAVQH